MYCETFWTNKWNGNRKIESTAPIEPAQVSSDLRIFEAEMQSAIDAGREHVRIASKLHTAQEGLVLLKVMALAGIEGDGRE